MTARLLIINELQKRSLSIREICSIFGIERKDAVDSLRHISKSILPRKRLVREDAVCRSCGFRFRDRVKFSTPTKCPMCRKESITEVRFRVE